LTARMPGSYASGMRLPSTLSASETAAIREFVAGARSILGPELKAARLFGSRARAKGHEHSDLDVALIVSAGGRARRHVLYDLAFDVGLAYGVELAPVLIEEQRFRELKDRERLIAFDIEVEGIPL
jgi:predicted nucleotidyltransferase